MRRKYNRYGGDPRQIKARYSSSCCKCGGPIKAEDEMFYWPNGRKAYCFSCGEPEYRRFLSAKADEEVYNGTGNPYAY